MVRVNLDLKTQQEFEQAATKDFVLLIRDTGYNIPQCFKADFSDYSALIINYKPLIARNPIDLPRILGMVEENAKNAKKDF